MSKPQNVRSCLLSLAGCLLLLGVTPSAAGAEGYGELGPFGRKGTGPGEFIVPESVHAFGVDTEDGSVSGHTSIFVGDEPGGGYRIQKFKPKINGEGKLEGEFLASRLIPVNKAVSLEGIAVDPVLKRVYVLALNKRGFGDKFDPGKFVAATLYAFSTETLAPAEGTKVEGSAVGVLVGPKELQTEADSALKTHEALLMPRGIAVDPSSHDVIVLGEQDDQAKLERGKRWNRFCVPLSSASSLTASSQVATSIPPTASASAKKNRESRRSVKDSKKKTKKDRSKRCPPHRPVKNQPRR